MNQEIMQRIDALANKLGTASEYLWGAMVKQQYIEPLYYVVPVIILGCFGLYALKNSHRRVDLADSDEPLFFLLFIFGCLSTLLSTILFFQLCGEVIDTINPGYAAFKGLMEQVGVADK